MFRYYSGSNTEVSFMQRFGRSLLVNMLLASEDAVQKIVKGAPGFSCLISHAKAVALLSWLSKYKSNYIAGSLEGLQIDSYSFEAIDALASMVAEWDQTVTDFDGLEEENHSPLSLYNSLIGNPSYSRVRDSISWKALFETVFARAIWSNSCERLLAAKPDELWRIIPHSLALHQARLESGSGARMASVDDMSKYRETIDKNVKTEMVRLIEKHTETLQAMKVNVDSPKEAIELAVNLSKKDTQKSLSEVYLAAHSDVAIANVALQLDCTVEQKKATPAESGRHANTESTTGQWVLDPLILGVSGSAEYEVYFPITIAISESLDCEPLGISLVKSIPDWATDTCPFWFGRDSGIFLRVSVLAATDEIARRIAGKKVGLLFDVIYGLDGRHLIYRYDPEFALALRVKEKNGRCWNVAINGLPETRTLKSDVVQNASVLLEISDDERHWCKQCLRAANLLRVAGEARNIETRFVNLWRALAVCRGNS